MDEPSQLEIAQTLLRQADEEATTNPEKCAAYLLEATPLLLIHFCRHEDMLPRESAMATIECMCNIGISFELAVSACRRVGVPLNDEGTLRVHDRSLEPTAFDLNEKGWEHITSVVLDQWNSCVKDHMTNAASFSRIVSDCAEELAPFSPESQLMILRLAGLPLYSISGAINRAPT